MPFAKQIGGDQGIKTTEIIACVKPLCWELFEDTRLVARCHRDGLRWNWSSSSGCPYHGCQEDESETLHLA